MATFESVKVTMRGVVRSQLASVARQANEKVMATDPRPVAVTRTVDGVVGTPEDAARTQIVYRYSRANDAVAFALQYLREHSPVESGAYRDAWFAMVDGIRIDDVKAINAPLVTITNDEPYSRKLNAGRLKMSVPPHMVEAAAQVVNARFGKQVRATVAEISLPNGYVRTGRFLSGRTVYPAVLIAARCGDVGI